MGVDDFTRLPHIDIIVRRMRESEIFPDNCSQHPEEILEVWCRECSESACGVCWK